MGWRLVGGTKKIHIRPGLVVGRADFPDDPLMSRRHCEFVEEQGRLYVRDLNSSNGVYVDEERIPPERLVELTPERSLRLGKITFQLQVVQAGEADQKKLIAEAAILLLFAAFIFSDATLDYGRSVGFAGFCAILATLIVPGLAIHFGFRRGPERMSRLGWRGHAVAAFFSFLILNTLTFQLTENIPGLTQHVLQNKIEYFCLRHFRDPDCVREVNRCPECAKKLSAETRRQILQNLKRTPSSQSR